MDHDQFIKAAVTPRLNHQCRIDDTDASRILNLPLAQDFVLARDDEGMKNVIQALALILIGEDYRSQLFSIKRAVRIENLLTEGLSNGHQTRRARHDDFTRRLVRI